MCRAIIDASAASMIATNQQLAVKVAAVYIISAIRYQIKNIHSNASSAGFVALASAHVITLVMNRASCWLLVTFCHRGLN
jgi:hypothetical protein